MEYKQPDVVLFSSLRKNGRVSLTEMSRLTKMPISTIYEKLKRYAGGVIQKYTVLLDFQKMGYTIKVMLVLKSMQREQLLHHLEHHQNINNAYKINNGYDVLCEGLFTDIHSAEMFIQSLEQFGVCKMEVFYILSDIKREGFFAEPYFE
jgi:DNA-binding Lrp family transcriptional regulator